MNSIKLSNRMDTIFINSENSKASDLHRLLLNLTDRIHLKRNDKYVALSNLSIYYTWKNIKKSHKNNNFKIFAPSWNEEVELPDETYSVSYIQGYLKYILKKYVTVNYNPSTRTYVNKIKNRITFKIKTGYYLKLLAPDAITKDENGENVPDLEIIEVV